MTQAWNKPTGGGVANNLFRGYNQPFPGDQSAAQNSSCDTQPVTRHTLDTYAGNHAACIQGQTRDLSRLETYRAAAADASRVLRERREAAERKEVMTGGGRGRGAGKMGVVNSAF